MLSDTERNVLNIGLQKYRPGQCEPILIGGEKLLKPALRLMTDYRLCIDEIKGTEVVTSYTRWWRPSKRGAGTVTELVKARAATPARLPDFVEPMKAKLVDSIPSGGGWIYEIKFNDYRALALRGASEIRILSRNQEDLGGRFWTGLRRSASKG
jgi:bifunctional non-homologous end joining protein LigD